MYRRTFVVVRRTSARTAGGSLISLRQGYTEHSNTLRARRGREWVANGNQQTGNIRGNGNEKLNKRLINRPRKYINKTYTK